MVDFVLAGYDSCFLHYVDSVWRDHRTTFHAFLSVHSADLWAVADIHCKKWMWCQNILRVKWRQPGDDSYFLPRGGVIILTV